MSTDNDRSNIASTSSRFRKQPPVNQPTATLTTTTTDHHDRPIEPCPRQRQTTDKMSKVFASRSSFLTPQNSGAKDSGNSNSDSSWCWPADLDAALGPTTDTNTNAGAAEVRKLAAGEPPTKKKRGVGVEPGGYSFTPGGGQGHGGSGSGSGMGMGMGNVGRHGNGNGDGPDRSRSVDGMAVAVAGQKRRANPPGTSNAGNAGPGNRAGDAEPAFKRARLSEHGRGDGLGDGKGVARPTPAAAAAAGPTSRTTTTSLPVSHRKQAQQPLHRRPSSSSAGPGNAQQKVPVPAYDRRLAPKAQPPPPQATFRSFTSSVGRSASSGTPPTRADGRAAAAPFIIDDDDDDEEDEDDDEQRGKAGKAPLLGLHEPLVAQKGSLRHAATTAQAREEARRKDAQWEEVQRKEDQRLASKRLREEVGVKKEVVSPGSGAGRSDVKDPSLVSRGNRGGGGGGGEGGGMPMARVGHELMPDGIAVQKPPRGQSAYGAQKASEKVLVGTMEERKTEVISLLSSASSSEAGDEEEERDGKPNQDEELDVVVAVDAKLATSKLRDVIDLDGPETSGPQDGTPPEQKPPTTLSDAKVQLPGHQDGPPPPGQQPPATLSPNAKATAPRATPSTTTKSAADAEAERQRKTRLENSRKQYEEIQTQLKTQAAAERQADEQARETERYAVEEAKQEGRRHSEAGSFQTQARERREAEARRVEEVKKEAAVRREVQVKEAEERLRAEAARRVEKERVEELFRQRRRVGLALPAAASSASTTPNLSAGVAKQCNSTETAQYPCAGASLTAEGERGAETQPEGDSFGQRKPALPPMTATPNLSAFTKSCDAAAAAKTQQPSVAAAILAPTTTGKVGAGTRIAKEVDNLLGTTAIAGRGQAAGLPEHGRNNADGGVDEGERAKQQRMRAMQERNERNRLASEPLERNNAAVSEAEQAKQQRVQALKERNERNRLAAEEDAEDVYAVPEEEEITVPRGPVSLNSFAGVQRLQAIKELGARPMQTPKRYEDDRRPQFGQMARPVAAKPFGPVSLNSAAGLDFLSHEKTSRPTPPAKPTSPVSLHSAAGRELLSRETARPQPSALRLPPVRQAHSTYHDASLGEILPEDVKLTMWRDGRNEWQDIVEDYEEATGVRRGQDTLRKRYRQVKEAIDVAGLDRAVVQRVATGDAEAREQLNRAIHGAWPVAKATKADNPRGDIRKVYPADAGVEQKKLHGRHLGDIIPEDIKVTRWRDSGMEWSKISSALEQVTGRKRAGDTHRKRYRQVKEVLDAANIDVDLLDLAETGDIHAIARVNKLVSGKRLSSVDFSKTPQYGPPLGEIMPEDAKLVMWRNSNIKFEDIIPLYQSATGVKRSLSMLYTRYRAVKAAVDSADIEEDLLELVADGDEDAWLQVNQMVRSTVPVSASKSQRNIKPLKLKQSPRDPFAGAAARARNIGRSDSESSPGSVRLSSDDLDDTTAAISPEYGTPESIPPNVPQAGRPTTSGKVMNEKAFMYYLAGLAEDEAEEQPEPEFTREDYCHNIYQVQRREVTREELDEEITIGMKEWIDCGRSYTLPGKANVAAPKHIHMALDPDLNDAIHTSEDYDIRTSRNEDDLVRYTVKLEEGSVQVQVVARMRTYQDHIKPSDTAEWRGRRVYTVRQRTVTRPPASDELFDEAQDSVRDLIVDDHVYSSLDLANKCALDHFVNEHFHCPSANLDFRQSQRAELRAGLLQELEAEGNGALFKRQVEAGDTVQEVRVEELRLLGPRNI
ncbi:hypothetical protein LTR36_009717 [Oleoguttula mirabilis]|uniref:Myb-like domain-containing protein n=1 Tax=Oleoguttula mirabilis TaxID=1507867 RepID=A0AAV9J697_9PEZI|nr:hypothetical protein LTR36_009717 [Oleoguttula mirabilis]